MPIDKSINMVRLEAFPGARVLRIEFPEGSTLHRSSRTLRLLGEHAPGFSWKRSLTTCTLTYQSPQYPSLVTPSLHSSSTGILTCCPSPTPLGLGLGPTNPTRTGLPSETLDFRRTCFSHVSRYSCQHSHFCPLQQTLPVHLRRKQNAPLPLAYANP